MMAPRAWLCVWALALAAALPAACGAGEDHEPRPAYAAVLAAEAATALRGAAGEARMSSLSSPSHKVVHAKGVDSYVFKRLTYSDITKKLETLAEAYPSYVSMTTAQAKYKVPSPGQCGAAACVQHIVTLTNLRTWTGDAKRTRPQVFFSGGLHGDERVGQVTTVEFIDFMMQNRASNPWLQHLLDTRVVVLTPMTNALGYFKEERRENSVDVNRDFPIDNPTAGCMKSMAARGLNELFRDSMFQVAVTFHGGINIIGGEWGTISSTEKASNAKSPDDAGQIALCSVLASYAGGFTGQPAYTHGRMDDVVYGVRGGMEDWAYASSWDPVQGKTPCTTQRSYDALRTNYTDSQLRVVNILVETGIDKNPTNNKMGARAGVLNPADTSKQGHVTRNIRLMLALIDLVQPYTRLTSVSGGGSSPTVAWEVGGAIYADSTWLEYDYVVNGGTAVTRSSSKLHGNTRWAGGKINAVVDSRIFASGTSAIVDLTKLNRATEPFKGAFSAQLSLPAGSVLSAIRVKATVDSAFKSNNGDWPIAKTQSHWVNARTDSTWSKSNAGYAVQGRTVFTSCYDAARAAVAC
jgi:hypothetical protein